MYKQAWLFVPLWSGVSQCMPTLLSLWVWAAISLVSRTSSVISAGLCSSVHVHHGKGRCPPFFLFFFFSFSLFSPPILDFFFLHAFSGKWSDFVRKQHAAASAAPVPKLCHPLCWSGISHLFVAETEQDLCHWNASAEWCELLERTGDVRSQLESSVQDVQKY